MPQYSASPRDLAPEFIRCRSLRCHPFQVTQDFHLSPDHPGLVVRDLLCSSCGAPARDLYSIRPVTALHSVLVRASPRRISYPDGYLIRPGKGSPPDDAPSTREAVDFEVCRRALASLSPTP